MRRVLVLLTLIALSAPAQAVQLIRTDGFKLPHGRTLTNETWVLAQDISFGGTAKDDFFAACAGGPGGVGNVRLAGTFENDVWAFGNTIIFSGVAKEHARFLANEVTMDGTVGLGALAAGNAVTLTTNSTIQGDAALAGQSVVIAGKVRGNLKVLATSATISGTIEGNIRIMADDIVVMPGTIIEGNLTYTSSKDLFLDPAHVRLDGQLIRTEVAAARQPSGYEVFLTQAYYYLCALVAGLPFIALFPRFTGRAVRHFRQSSWRCALIGVIAFCLIPMAALFLLLTIVGIPLGFLLLLSYAIMGYLAKIVVALGVGGALLRRHGPQPFSRVFTSLSIGLISIYAMAVLPYGIGMLVAFLVVVLGLGAIVLAIFTSHSALETAPPLPPPVPAVPPSSSGSYNSKEETPKKE